MSMSNNIKEDLALFNELTTVFLEDDEAEEIWSKRIGIPSNRIVRMDEKDNFWSMGDTGPCGPCSELIYDQGTELNGSPPGVDNDDGDRFLELWNLVFMQYDRDIKGNLNLLPKPSVDTGMGLERLVSVVQGKKSNFHTDLLMPVIKFCEEKTGINYEESENDRDVSFRVIADHSRAISFLISEVSIISISSAKVSSTASLILRVSFNAILFFTRLWKNGSFSSVFLYMSSRIEFNFLGSIIDLKPKWPIAS